ncbi:MAG: hypothetical protein QXT26_04500 [Thermoproteota archaeon]
MSINGQEILALHELGYRFADRLDTLSCLQTQVLLEALRFRNERIREALEKPSSSGDVRPLNDLIHVLPQVSTVEGSPIKDESAVKGKEEG